MNKKALILTLIYTLNTYFLVTLQDGIGKLIFWVISVLLILYFLFEDKVHNKIKQIMNMRKAKKMLVIYKERYSVGDLVESEYIYEEVIDIRIGYNYRNIPDSICLSYKSGKEQPIYLLKFDMQLKLPIIIKQSRSRLWKALNKDE